MKSQSRLDLSCPAILVLSIGCAAGRSGEGTPPVDEGDSGAGSETGTFGGDASADCSHNAPGCPCTAGATAACWTGPASDRNRGTCHDGTQTCVTSMQGEHTQAEWGPCTGEQLVCNACTMGGSQTYSTPGTFTFTVPDYKTLTVEVWGGGGGGQGARQIADPTAGGSSSFNGTVVAGGGASGDTGTGGTASGGTTNTSGGQGGPSCYYPALGGEAAGGAAPQGGAGGSGVQKALDGCNGGDGNDGLVPGGGGASDWACEATWWQGTGWGASGGAGGGGAYSTITYSMGQLAPGSALPVVVGAGGQGSKGEETSGFPGTGRNPGYYTGGDGAAGEVKIAWTCPGSP